MANFRKNYLYGNFKKYISILVSICFLFLVSSGTLRYIFSDKTLIPSVSSLSLQINGIKNIKNALDLPIHLVNSLVSDKVSQNSTSIKISKADNAQKDPAEKQTPASKENICIMSSGSSIVKTATSFKTQYSNGGNIRSFSPLILYDLSVFSPPGFSDAIFIFLILLLLMTIMKKNVNRFFLINNNIYNMLWKTPL